MLLKSLFVVKHVQHVGIIRAFWMPEGLIKFFSAWGTDEIAGLWFARRVRGASTHADTVPSVFLPQYSFLRQHQTQFH